MSRSQNSSVTPQPNRKGVKTLIATASLAATLGGWAILSAEREPAQAVKVAPTATMPRPTAIVFELPPLPTLVSSFVITPTMVTGQTHVEPTSTPIPQPTLRVVNAPPPQRVIVLGGGGDGGSNGGAQPAAQTRSSR